MRTGVRDAKKKNSPPPPPPTLHGKKRGTACVPAPPRTVQVGRLGREPSAYRRALLLIPYEARRQEAVPADNRRAFTVGLCHDLTCSAARHHLDFLAWRERAPSASSLTGGAESISRVTRPDSYSPMCSRCIVSLARSRARAETCRRIGLQSGAEHVPPWQEVSVPLPVVRM